MNLAYLSVCLFVSNKRQNGWTDRAQILWCDTSQSRNPREDLWMVKILKILKMHEKNIMKSATFFCFCFILYKRGCSQIKPQLKVEIEYGREAP